MLYSDIRALWEGGERGVACCTRDVGRHDHMPPLAAYLNFPLFALHVSLQKKMPALR